MRAARAIAGVLGVGTLIAGTVGLVTAHPSSPRRVVVRPASPSISPPSLAAGFEGYQPGDPLPEPPPSPGPGMPVETVPGPHGPIYPDGYVEPSPETEVTTATTTVTVPVPLPVCPPGEDPGNPQRCMPSGR